MRIILIGASGTVGSMIMPFLREKHEVITAARTTGDLHVDIASLSSIQKLYAQTGKIDAVVCMAGESVSAELAAMRSEHFETGIQQKLLSQINLVLAGLHYLNDRGSFTLISGKMGEQPAKGSSGKAVINGAINSFVLAASLEMPRGIRINVVSPAKITNEIQDELIAAYTKAIDGPLNGQIIRVHYN